MCNKLILHLSTARMLIDAGPSIFDAVAAGLLCNRITTFEYASASSLAVSPLNLRLVLAEEVLSLMDSNSDPHASSADACARLVLTGRSRASAIRGEHERDPGSRLHADADGDADDDHEDDRAGDDLSEVSAGDDLPADTSLRRECERLLTAIVERLMGARVHISNAEERRDQGDRGAHVYVVRPDVSSTATQTWKLALSSTSLEDNGAVRTSRSVRRIKRKAKTSTPSSASS